MAFSTDLNSLLKCEFAARDLEWEKAFFHAFPEAKLKILNDTPAAGPDGWPYLLAEISHEGSEPAAKVLSWLSDKGIGLVVNPGKETPDYVFSYGMIWNYRERAEFLSAQAAATGPAAMHAKVEKVEFEGQKKVLAGPPDEKYLPDYARIILKSFFRDNGISAMKILVLSEDLKHFDLCFSLEALGAPAPEEHKSILEALSWFMPAHYSLMLISEQGLPAFANL